jgi:hypothetical protein
MRINHVIKENIFESFDIDHRDPYFEHWQREIHPLLMEVALAPEQIKQLFKSIETTASAQGSNRTMAGKAVDAAGEVSEKLKDMWYNKLGGALANSQPVKDFDAKWEDIKSKFAAKHPDIAKKLAKYGEFAKNNPTSHKFLLAIAGSLAAALGLAAVGGAAAGIAATGLGVGGATALVSIADRLLKGEKASTAIGRGATAGIVAGLTAAGVKAASEMFNSIANSFKPGQEYHEIMLGNPPRKVLINAEDGEMLAKLHQDAMSQMKGQDVADLLNSGGATPGLDKYMSAAEEVAKRAADPAYQKAIQDAAGQALDLTVKLDILQANAAEAAKTIAPIAGALAGQKAGGAGEKKESYYVQTRPLSEGQVYLLLKKIAATEQLNEGPMDWVKKGAAAVGKGIQRVGQNITNKITYEKLLAGWKLDGSPIDSEQLKKFLTSMEVSDEIVNKVYADMKISSGADSAAATQSTYAQVKDSVAKLDKKSRQRMLKYIQGQLGSQS